MSKEKTFKLVQPIEGHEDDLIRELVFREPMFRDLMALGEPQTITLTEEGRPFVIENPVVLLEYAKRCLVSPKGFLLVESQLGFEDGMAVKVWLESFFLRGGRVKEGSPKSPEISGSNAASTQAP